MRGVTSVAAAASKQRQPGIVVGGLYTIRPENAGPRGVGMTCRELVEFLNDYLDGQLPGPERRRFERHLGDCPDCVAYLTTYRAAVRLGKEVCRCEDESVPAEVPEQLVRAVLSALGRQPPG